MLSWSGSSPLNFLADASALSRARPSSTPFRVRKAFAGAEVNYAEKARFALLRTRYAIGVPAGAHAVIFAVDVFGSK